MIEDNRGQRDLHSTKPRLPIWGAEVPARNRYFTGRTELLAKLRAELTDPDDPHIGVLSQPPQAIIGLGGVGKTEVATEYAHRYANDYQIIWWIRAESVDSIREAFIKLGRRLNLARGEPQSQDKTIYDVQEALRSGKYDRWLLIFDNAEDPAMVKEYLPLGPPGGHVIITSRFQYWHQHTRAESIEVLAFERDETTAFLHRRVSDLAPVPSEQEGSQRANERRKAAAKSLADALDNLPLAAEHAAAYLNEHRIGVNRYLELFRSDPHRLMSEIVDIHYNHRAVAVTWSITMRKLSTDALEVFNLAAFFSPEPIAFELFLRGARDVEGPEQLRQVLQEPSRFRAGLSMLHRFSLVRIDGERDTVQVHRVVQAVTHGQIRIDRPEDARHYEEAVHALLAATDPLAPDREQYDYLYNRSLQHLGPANAVRTENPLLRNLIINQVRRLHLRGRQEESLRLGERALEVWRDKHGQASPETLRLAVEVATAMRQDGRNAESQQLNRSTRELAAQLHQDGATDEIRRQAYEIWLICSNSYGGDLRSQGEFEEALALDLDLLPRFEETFLPHADRTLNVRNNIGADYRRLGQFEQALKHDQITYQLRESTLGSANIRTLSSKDAIAQDMRYSGLYYQALSVASDAVSSYESLHHEENLDWLNAQKGYGVALRRVGRHADALEEARKTVARYTAFVGPDHRYTLRASTNLINDLRIAGDVAEAEKLGQDVLRRCREGDQPPSDLTYAVMVALAIVLRLHRNPTVARRQNEEAVKGLNDLFGSDHPFTLIAKTNLASDLFAAGYAQQARKLDEETLEAGRRVRGPNHPETLATAANLSLDIRACGDENAAKELLDDTLRRYHETLSLEHPDARTAENQGRVDIDGTSPRLVDTLILDLA